jgi:hypothetical protein
MKIYHLKKEWCKVILFGKVNLCLQTEFQSDQIDLIMIGTRLRDGVGISLLGVTLSIQWGDGSMFS